MFKTLGLIINLININVVFASTFIFGGNISTSLPTVRFPIVSEPHEISGSRFALELWNNKFHWHKMELFLDLSVASWSSFNDNIFIAAAAPVFRYSYFSSNFINPFIDLSVGPGYLSKTRFVNNNLGIHYTFQDMLGLGFKLGQKKNMTVSWKMIHYSNAGLSAHNRGITIPLICSMEYHM